MSVSKLWETEDSVAMNPVVAAYIQGNDHLLDQKLLGYDIQASIAHTTMLGSIGVVSEVDSFQLVAALKELAVFWAEGKFMVLQRHEDGHTAIEEYLTDRLGDAGKRIHTGRSRNDQSLVMMRLYAKDHMASILAHSSALIDAIKGKAAQHQGAIMPGYTHMQKAMPTTVDVWLESFAVALKDQQQVIKAALTLIDQNPLGSAAGFGVSIPVDKHETAEILGFAGVQDNPMYCALSRGLFEATSLQSLSPSMAIMGTFASDLLLFTTEEFDYFSLPKSFTTGSSIMPQKNNYDVLEVLRGECASFGVHAQRIMAVYSGMGSGYHRDLQLTKGVFIDAIELCESIFSVMNEVVKELIVHDGKLEAAITDEMLSVDKINNLVGQGVSFRDAYKKVKIEL